MARNQEKSMAMLNRWQAMKTTITRGRLQRRPRYCDAVEDIRECEHWRNQVVRETTRKIAEIQNAGLGEHRIRDLNDEINKLLKEKIKDVLNTDIRLGFPSYVEIPTGKEIEKVILERRRAKLRDLYLDAAALTASDDGEEESDEEEKEKEKEEEEEECGLCGA
eukprot:Selendium_serpulae@DN4904_c1_g1_i2.p1